MATTNVSLNDRLQKTPWRQLLAIMAANQLSIVTSQPKLVLISLLHDHLSKPETISAILSQLSPLAKDALRALLAANGALPVHTFEEHFGPVRPYRPWRKDDRAGDPHPWLAPISATETLWYLGLIFRDPPKRKPGIVQQVVLPADFMPHLTAELAQPVTQLAAGAAPGSTQPLPGRNGPLDHHLTLWLATINERTIRPVHKHWLPPSLVALLCTRLGLDQAAAFTPIRSERHHAYLAFLHYLALAADLIAITPAAFQLTPTAWAWLTADPTTRHQQLYNAWHTAPLDLAQRFRFRWEPLSPQARAFITAQLAHLSHTQPLPVEQLMHHWHLLDSRALLPESRLAEWHDETSIFDPLGALITGPLHWLGLVELWSNRPASSGPDVPVAPDMPVAPDVLVQRHSALTINGSALTILPAPIPPAPCTMPKQPINTIRAQINVQPLHLVQLARCCDWQIAVNPTATPHTFTINPDKVAQLAAAGIAAAQLLEQLTAALGRKPNRRLIQRVQNWMLPGQQLRLRSLLVLESDTPTRLAQLRRHKLVRNRLGEVIAPTRIALNPDHAPALAQTLRTLGYFVALPATTPSLPSTGSGNEGVVAGSVGDESASGLSPMLQWFLITCYQGLGQHLPLPVDLPWEIRQELRTQLTPLQQASAEAAATQLLESHQAALNGYLQLSAWQMPATTDPEPLIRTALEKGHDIEIRYWGPADGHTTTRTVTPYWIEERHTILYLIGWCHLRQQERTFRLDRIESIRCE